MTMEGNLNRARGRILGAALAIFAVFPQISWAQVAGPLEARDLDAFLEGNACKSKVIQKLDTWERTRKFRRAASAFDGAIAFRSPTKKVGQWIEVDVFQDNSVIAYRVTPLSVTRTVFEGLDCQPVDKDLPKLID